MFLTDQRCQTSVIQLAIRILAMHENDSYLEDLQDEIDEREEMEREREDHAAIKEGKEC